MPHALLLSPDDQAVSAITSVLEEMSVSCERPLDGTSAAQKLNSQSFDMVLVDCENLTAAQLIFDVCRRGKNGHNPVAIAIVDGRAGLPTAFRMGAELILTKPVAKDQARTTVRTAVSRVRKDAASNDGLPAHHENAASQSPVATMTADRAHAAAATASPLLTSFADSDPGHGPSSSTAATSTISAPAFSSKMHSAVDQSDAPAPTPKPKPLNSKTKFPPSDDPVLAELEQSELEESEPAESRKPETPKHNSEHSTGRSSRPAQAAPSRLAAQSAAPVFSAYSQGRQKPRGALVASLMLALTAAGFYTAWNYEPGFRTIAQPQIDRLLALAGMAPPAAAARPVKPSAQLPPPTVSAPAPVSPTAASKTPAPAAPATTIPATSTATSAPAPPAAAAEVTAVAPKPETSNPPDGVPATVQNTAPAASSETLLPGESSAVILSSKGAEKRLAYKVPPKYPFAARSRSAEGTILLKEVVDATGRVEGVRLLDGNPALATAAIKAVKQWRYRPYIHNGSPQPFQTVVIIDFQRP